MSGSANQFCFYALLRHFPFFALKCDVVGRKDINLRYYFKIYNGYQSISKNKLSKYNANHC